MTNGLLLLLIENVEQPYNTIQQERLAIGGSEHHLRPYLNCTRPTIWNNNFHKISIIYVV